MSETLRFSLEQRIWHLLMLKTFFEKEIGISNGKMGILLALVEYNRLYPNKVYEEYIDNLIDNVWENIHQSLPIDFASGLSGIGWGVDFLLYHKIIGGSSTELCKEIDERIMQTDPRRMADWSFENGLGGIMHYVLMHLGSALLQGDELPFDDTYLHDLYQAVIEVDPGKTDKKFQNDAKQYVGFYLRKEIPKLSFSLEGLVDGMTVNESKLSNYPLGLKQGLAGVLIKRTVLNCV